MKIRSSAPGRICLFGEHQDYISFPVIAAALDLNITIEGEVSTGNIIQLHLTDMNEQLTFNSNTFKYSSKKDYLKSVVNILKRKNCYKHKAINAAIKGNIPIQAGTSSSSALVVAWIGFLLQSAGHIKRFLKNPASIGELAYLAEVEEFNESGGRMDQYASAIGGIVYINFHNGMKVTKLPVFMKEFVLGDSQQPKNTQKTLKRIRNGYERGFLELSKYLKFKDKFLLSYEETKPFINKVSSDLRPYLQGALLNHKITDAAKDELLKKNPNIKTITNLMNNLQKVLREYLNISTPKLETMIKKSLDAGALAAKINGSGEGGCMFAFCPGKQQEVAEAIKEVGGTPYIINIGRGLEVKVVE